VGLVSVLTLGALPAIWLVNRQDERATPDAAGAAAADGVPAATTSTTMPDVMGTVAPRFLNGTNDSVPQATNPPVFVGEPDGTVIADGTATYRRDVSRPGVCLTNSVEAGQQVTVVNIDNGRSIACTTEARAEEEAALADEIVLLTQDFAQIADLTDAPVNIEIRQ